MTEEASKYSPFFDQEQPEVPILGMVGSWDASEPWELEATAVFKTDRGFLVVFVSGCSCWPDRGSTYQEVCEDRIAVTRCLMSSCSFASAVLEQCEGSKWEIVK